MLFALSGPLISLLVLESVLRSLHFTPASRQESLPQRSLQGPPRWKEKHTHTPLQPRQRVGEDFTAVFGLLESLNDKMKGRHTHTQKQYSVNVPFYLPMPLYSSLNPTYWNSIPFASGWLFWLWKVKTPCSNIPPPQVLCTLSEHLLLSFFLFFFFFFSSFSKYLNA